MSPNLLENVFQTLKEALIDNSTTNVELQRIFRVHNNNLGTNGDFSFPLNLSCWQKLSSKTKLAGSRIEDLFKKYENGSLPEEDFNLLIETTQTKCSKNHLSSLKLFENKVLGYLERASVIKVVLKNILYEKQNYGQFDFHGRHFVIKIDPNCTKNDLNNLRLELVRNAIEKILEFSIFDEEIASEITEIFVTNSSNLKVQNKIVCGPVTTQKNGRKNTILTAEEYLKKRTLDMQLMAQHKYGLRVTKDPGWNYFFQKLGDAAVKIDILHVKINRPVIINENCTTGTSSRGASFVLYNCARLSEIFRKFEKNIENSVIGPLPEFEDIDFNLLNQEEEWEIVFVHLLQFSNIIKSCISNIEKCEVKLHNLSMFLDSLSNIFSVYYRRVRILTESRPHLLPTMYARIYLLKGIQQVFNNALNLLDITPVKKM